jgi:hypothetical protein
MVDETAYAQGVFGRGGPFFRNMYETAINETIAKSPGIVSPRSWHEQQTRPIHVVKLTVATSGIGAAGPRGSTATGQYLRG